MGTGVLTSMLTLGNGGNGESIEWIPAHLSGTLIVAAVDGVATFTDLAIDGSGVGYTLVANAFEVLCRDGVCLPVLTGSTSAAFDINP